MIRNLFNKVWPILLMLVIFSTLASTFMNVIKVFADGDGYHYRLSVDIINSNTSSKTARIAIPINAKGLVDNKYIQADAQDVSMGSYDCMATDLTSNTAKWYTDIVTIPPQSTISRTFYLGDSTATRDQTFISYDGDTITAVDDDSLDITTNLTLTADVYLDSLPTEEKAIISKDGAYELSVDDTNYNFSVIVEEYDDTGAIYSSASDNYLFNNNASYATARTAATGSLGGGTSAAIGQNFSGGLYTPYRAGFYFNTSGIPDDAVVTAANLHLYGMSDSSTTAEFDLVIRSGQPTYPHDPMAVGDYLYTQYAGDGGSINTTSFVTAAYNTIPLNATGLEWINVTGTTKLMVISSRDINGNTPTGAEMVLVYTTDWGGTANDPYLDITYYVPTEYSVSAAATTDAWKTVKGTYDGSNAKIYVDEVEKDSEALTGNIPSNANNVIFMEAQGKYDNLKIGGSSIETPTWVTNYAFEPDEISSTTITDLSESTNDASMTLEGNPAGVTVSVRDLQVVSPNQAASTTSEYVSPFVTATPNMPDNYYDEDDYSKLPGAAIINNFLDMVGIPQSFFWVPVICGAAIAIGLYTYGKSRSLLAEGAAVIGIVAFAAGLGMIGWWYIVVSAIIMFAIMLKQHSYGF